MLRKGSVESTHKVSDTDQPLTRETQDRHVAKGSVESTHKVPTSHYHAKHCHAVVGTYIAVFHADFPDEGALQVPPLRNAWGGVVETCRKTSLNSTPRDGTGMPRCLFTGTLQVISPSMSNPSRLEHADSSSMGTETATPGKAMSRPGGSPPLRALISPRPLSHLSRRFRRSIC
jgi:hypothetical protein